jgi:hypothetical protein
MHAARNRIKRNREKREQTPKKKKKREAEAEPFAAAQLLLVTYMYVTPIIRRSRIVMKYHVSLRLWHRKKKSSREKNREIEREEKPLKKSPGFQSKRVCRP